MDLIPISKANWDAYHNRAFCKFCKEEIEMTGKKHDRKQFKNHWEALKKEYSLRNELKLKSTGLGWDPQKGTIAASDAWWNDHIKNHPKHKHFRDGPPENLAEMEVMFEKAYVTGNTSAIPGETSQAGHNVVEVDGLEDGVETAAANVDTTDDYSNKPKGPTKHRGASITPSPKNRKNPMARDFKRMVDIMASGPAPTGPSIAEVRDIAIQAGVVEGSDEHFIVTRLFTKQENREVFVTMKTDEGKTNWLKRMFDLKMN